MRFCMEHWDRLKKAIEDRGLNHLIAKDGEAAMDSTVRQLKGQDDASDLDPLMSATMGIYSAFVRDIGLAAMGVDENGNELCPLCGVKRQRDDLDENWIQGAATDSLDQARYLKLMPEAS